MGCCHIALRRCHKTLRSVRHGAARFGCCFALVSCQQHPRPDHKLPCTCCQVRCACQAASGTPATLMMPSQRGGRRRRRWGWTLRLCRWELGGGVMGAPGWLEQGYALWACWVWLSLSPVPFRHHIQLLQSKQAAWLRPTQHQHEPHCGVTAVVLSVTRAACRSVCACASGGVSDGPHAEQAPAVSDACGGTGTSVLEERGRVRGQQLQAPSHGHARVCVTVPVLLARCSTVHHGAASDCFKRLRCLLNEVMPALLLQSVPLWLRAGACHVCAVAQPR